jgi:hypothetical protein
LADVKKT